MVEVEGDPGSCCSSDFSLVGKNARSRSLPQVGWFFFAEKKTIETFFAQDDFCRLVGESGCLGWDSGVGSDCFPLDPDQGDKENILYIQTKVIDQDQGDEENIL